MKKIAIVLGGINQLYVDDINNVRVALQSVGVGSSVDLNSCRAWAADQIGMFATECRAQVTGYADRYKLSGWSEKSQRALRVVAGLASDADKSFIELEALERGIGETVDELAEKQKVKSGRLAGAIAVIDGMESSAKKGVLEAIAVDQVAHLLASLKVEAGTKLGQLLS